VILFFRELVLSPLGCLGPSLLRRFHLILFYLVLSSQSLSLSMSGSSGSTRASRRSPGAPTRAPRSPIHGAANSGSIRPSNNVFGALAEDGKDSGDAEGFGTSFPASFPFFLSSADSC